MSDFKGTFPLELWVGDAQYGPYKLECKPGIPPGEIITGVSAETTFDGLPLNILTPDSLVHDGTDVYFRLTTTSATVPGDYILWVKLNISSTWEPVKYFRFGVIKVKGRD